MYVGSVLSNGDLNEEFEFVVSSAYRYVNLLHGVGIYWVKVNGDEYKISSGVILEVKDDLPIVGVIQDIYLLNENKVMFKVDEHSTSFEPHYRAYILDNDPLSLKTVYHSDLFIQTSVHIRTSCISELSTRYIILPYALCVCE